MANGAWFDMFSAATTEFLEINESHHRPLVYFLTNQVDVPRKTFRFDNRMCGKDGFRDSVMRGWKGTCQMQLLDTPLAQRLVRCRQHISIWKRHNQHNAGDNINRLRGQLDRAITSTTMCGLREEIDQAYMEE